MAKTQNKSKALLDLSKEVLLHVDGEDEKNNTIPWDKLKIIGDKLEALVLSLAKNSAQDIDSANLENFKLSFVGFFKGSAVPAWKLPEPIPNLFGHQKATKIVNADFSLIMNSIDKGDYSPIIERFKNNEIKNEIITKIYDLTNSAGDSPVSIVKRKSKTSKTFIPIYRIHRLKQEARDKLIGIKGKIVPIVPDTTKTGVGKVVLKRSGKTGTVRKQISEILNENEGAIVIKFSNIETEERNYIFALPVQFEIDKDKSGCFIENEQLDLYSAAETQEQATKKLFYQFDHSYKRFNTLNDSQLSPFLLRVKQYYNFIVKSVIEK